MNVRRSLAPLSAAMAIVFAAVPFAAIAEDTLHGQPEPAMKGIHWARGHQPAAGPNGSSGPNMTWHGGAIMHDAQVLPIYWGTSWSNASFVGDKINGLEAFYRGMNASSYADTTNEYTGPNGSTITSSITYVGLITDTSATPSNVGNRTSPILSEVCKALSATGVPPVSNGYYAVYVDQPRGHAGYCAWHSAGSCNGVNVQFAFFFNLDGDPGCDPRDSSGQHSQGLAALANVSGHELSEARTDPRLNAWYDSSGAENSDKCAWAFATSLLPFTNGTSWKIQGNWSNAAYNTGTGYPNNSGQAGCIDGGNF